MQNFLTLVFMSERQKHKFTISDSILKSLFYYNFDAVENDANDGTERIFALQRMVDTWRFYRFD